MRRFSSSQDNIDLVREGGILPVPIPFGKYYLLEKIATGGMAEIFKAKAFGVEGFERLLAVKRLLSTISEDGEFISMFIDEAKIAGRLNHANIAQIFDLGKAEGSYYISLEYVSGQDTRTIFDRCRRNRKKLGVDMACYVTMKVCEGLDYAHNKTDSLGNPLHIVHRDVSPQNILVSYEGEVKLIDFGIAKAVGKSTQTQVGILKGKFSYMSPEQVRGLSLDRRSDLFSLSICLYELLTSERLFLGDSDFETLERIRKVEVTPPSLYNPHIPKELEDIVLKGLAKDPNTRYQTAHELQQALQKFMFNQSFHFTNKDLAANMQGLFAEELRLERKKVEYYQTLDLDTIRRQSGGSTQSSVMKGSGSGLEWDDDEIPTTIWDRPDGDSDVADVINDFDYHGEDEWVGGADTALDSPPPPPIASGDEQRLAHPELYQDAWDRILGPQQDAPQTDLDEVISRDPSPKPRIIPSHHFGTAREPRRISWLLLATLITLALILGAGGAYLLFFSSPGIELLFETQPTAVQILLDDEIIYEGTTPFTYTRASEGNYLLTVRAQGHEPKSRVVALRNGESYSITWALTPLPSTPGPLRVTSNPPGAAIWIDGVDTGHQTPSELTNLARGLHTVRLYRDGHQEVMEPVTIDDQPVQLDRNLYIDQYQILLDVQPPGARFWLSEGDSGAEVATGTVTSPIPPVDGRKSYLLIIEADRYHREAQILEPSTVPQRVVQLSLRPLSSTGDVPVAAVDPSSPPGAQVETVPRQAAQEQAAVEASAAPPVEEVQPPREEPRGHRDRSRQRQERERTRERETPVEQPETVVSAPVEATTAGEQAETQAAASPEATDEPTPVPSSTATATGPGRLSVGSRPTAHVFLDGRDLGFTPIRNYELPPGNYEVRLVNEEFNLDHRQSVTIRSGEEERVIFRLD